MIVDSLARQESKVQGQAPVGLEVGHENIGTVRLAAWLVAAFKL